MTGEVAVAAGVAVTGRLVVEELNCCDIGAKSFISNSCVEVINYCYDKRLLLQLTHKTYSSEEYLDCEACTCT